MNSEILVASSFECGHVLSILRVAFVRFGDTMSFDEHLHCYGTRLQFLDSSFETPEYRVRRPRDIETLETVSLDILDKRWG